METHRILNCLRVITLFSPPLLALLLPLAAVAAPPPPGYYWDMLLKATHHVQVRVLDLQVLEEEGKLGACFIKAKVVRVFKDRTHKLETGREIEFSVPCTSSQPAPGSDLMPIAAFWALGAAKYLEVYLNGTETDLLAAERQVFTITAPTNEPTCPPDYMPGETAAPAAGINDQKCAPRGNYDQRE